MIWYTGGEGGLTWEHGAVMVTGLAGGIAAAVIVVLCIYYKHLSRH